MTTERVGQGKKDFFMQPFHMMASSIHRLPFCEQQLLS
jgi:hypothetical protein